MIIVLRPDATKRQIGHIIEKVKKLGLKPWVSKGVERSIIGVIGEEDTLRIQPLDVFHALQDLYQGFFLSAHNDIRFAAGTFR